MKAAVVIGSLGAVLLATRKNRDKPKDRQEGLSVDPLADTSVPACGRIFSPACNVPVIDRGPYCIVDAALCDCAKKLSDSGRVPHSKARQISNNKHFRKQLANLILTSPFNDALYGERPVGHRSHVGPHGRTIEVSAKHADNISKIRSGEPLVRTIDSRGRVVMPAESGHLPALWIPLIDLDILAQGSVTTGCYEYEDGSSTMVPPPPIMGLV